MANRRPRTYVLASGLGLVALGLLPVPFGRGWLSWAVFLGVALVVGSAAAVASYGRSEGLQGAREGTTVAVVTLSTLILVPFAVLGVLLLLRADALATYLYVLAFFAWAGLLVVLFGVVFFAARVAQRRAEKRFSRAT